MAHQQVIVAVRDALKDPDTGLVVQCAAIAAALGIPLRRIRTDFNYVNWILKGLPQTSDQPNLAVEPEGLTAEVGNPQNIRDQLVRVAIGYELYYSDDSVIEDNIAVVLPATLRVIDTLPQWSENHGRTILEVQGDIQTEIGPYVGSPTAGGFRSRLTLLERSTL